MVSEALRAGHQADARGYQNAWIVYKLRLDTADGGGIPVTALLTSASLHDKPGRDPAGEDDGTAPRQPAK